MPIDPLAPGKLFAQIFAARQQREAERANLMAQLQARQEEGAADREQQRLAREQQGQQFMESLNLNKTQHTESLAAQQEAARFNQNVQTSELLKSGRVEPTQFGYNPVDKSLTSYGGAPTFITPSGVAMTFVPREIQEQREVARAASAHKAGIDLQLKMIKDIADRTDIDSDSKQAMQSIVAGRDISHPPTMWSVGREIAEALSGGDKAKRIKEQRKFYMDMQRTPPTMDAAHAQYYRVGAALNLNKLTTEVHAEAASKYMYMAEAELRKNPEEYNRILNNPMAYQAAIQGKLHEMITNKQIPAAIPVDTGLDKPIMKDTLTGAMEAWHSVYDRMKLTKPESFIERKLRQSEEGPPNATTGAARGITPPPF